LWGGEKKQNEKMACQSFRIEGKVGRGGGGKNPRIWSTSEGKKNVTFPTPEGERGQKKKETVEKRKKGKKSEKTG